MKGSAMTYRKPEINTLGDAVHVVQGVPKPLGQSFDPCSPRWYADPAYDLDE